MYLSHKYKYFDYQYNRHNFTIEMVSLSVPLYIYSIAHTYLNGVCIFKVKKAIKWYHIDNPYICDIKFRIHIL